MSFWAIFLVLHFASLICGNPLFGCYKGGEHPNIYIYIYIYIYISLISLKKYPHKLSLWYPVLHPSWLVSSPHLCWSSDHEKAEGRSWLPQAPSSELWPEKPVWQWGICQRNAMGTLRSLGKWKDNGSIMIFLVRNILMKMVISSKYWEYIYIGISWEHDSEYPGNITNKLFLIVRNIQMIVK